MKRWYRLDNIAKHYSAVTKKTNTCVFRLSAILTESIDANTLQQAAEITIKRFPTMAVKLRKGLFWNYLYENNNPFVVREESACPCAPIMGSKDNNEYLFRIMYYRRRITLECFHALTDGKGAMEFLKSLLYQYLRLTGKAVQDDGLLLLPESTPEQQEAEDGYLKYYQKSEKKIKFEMRKAHAFRGTVSPNRGTRIIHGVIPSAPLSEYARRHGTTITGYLTAVFAEAIISSESQRGQIHHPIRICIPVNLRELFPSKTLKNFSSQISVRIPPGSEYGFDKHVESITAQMKAFVKREYFSGIITTYVGYEKMLAIRVVPWFIKKAAIEFIAKQSEITTTAVLTNLGNVKLPESMYQYIDMIEAVPSHKKAASVNCGVCSVGGKLNISFSSNIVESDVTNRFFDLLCEQTGLEVETYSNGCGKTDTLPLGTENFYPTYASATPNREKRVQIDVTTSLHQRRKRIQTSIVNLLRHWRAIIHV